MIDPDLSAGSLGSLFQGLFPQDELQRQAVQWLLVDVLLRVRAHQGVAQST